VVGLKKSNHNDVCHNHMTARHVSARPDLLIHNTVSTEQTPTASAPPLVRGMWAVASQPTGELGVEKREGGPRKWEAQAVRFLSSLLSSPATNACYTQAATTTTSLASKREREVVTFVVLTRLPPPPPPSHPNASRRWLF
jgi:hypothetical protein